MCDLLWGNCQVTNNGAEGSWSVSHISRLSPDCDTGPGAGARPTSGSGPEMSLSVSGLRWVSAGGADTDRWHRSVARAGKW